MSESTPTHYETLGLNREASADDVRRAWRVLVQEWHPDRFPETERASAEERASQINAAYHVLRDTGRRAAYDCRLAADEADAAREANDAQQQRQRARAAGPTVHPSERVGAPHVHAVSLEAEPITLERLGQEALRIVRAHPRAVAACAAAWVVLVGGTFAWNAVTGPSLPARIDTSPSVMHVRDARAMSEDAQDFDELAERATREVDAANDELERQMRLDAERQDALDRQIEAEEHAAADREARAARARAKAGGAQRLGSASPQRRTVRVLPGGVIVAAS